MLLSTIIIGGGFHLIAGWLGLAVPLIWCLVFGALISPTDPVAVMGILGRAEVSPTLKATVAGESLFNDGVGVVVFAILLEAALGTEPLSLGHGAALFLQEAGGGVLLGLAAGWIGYRAMRSIDEYNVEVMISLAVVMGGYALAAQLHISGPVAMAVAGLLIGNKGVADAMSDITRDYLLKFWALIDDILNAVLFLLIGLEVVTIPWDPRLIALGRRGGTARTARPRDSGRRSACGPATDPVARTARAVDTDLGRPAWRNLGGAGPWPARRPGAVYRAGRHIHRGAVLGDRARRHC